MFHRTVGLLIRGLRWSEKYTKTDMVYLASGGFWSVIGQFAAASTSLLLAFMFSKYLPKEVYGEYKYVISTISLLSVFTLSGLSGAVFQSVARGFDGALKASFWINVRWSLLMFFITLCISIYYFFANNYQLAIGILLGGSLSPFLTSANLAGVFLAAKKDFRRLTIFFDVIANLFPVLTLILTLYFTRNTVSLVSVYFISNLLVALYLFKRTVDIYNPAATRTDAGTLTYSKHLSTMNILSGIAANIDQILLFHYVGAAQVAIYNFSIAIPEQIKGPLKRLDAMMQAKFATRSDSQIKSAMANRIFLLSFFYGSIALIYVLLAPSIFEILFPNYMESVFFSQVYVLSILFFALWPVTSYLSVKKKVYEQYVINISTAIFQIFSMFVGVIFFGLLGLVIARVAARLFTACVSYILYLRSSRQIN